MQLSHTFPPYVGGLSHVVEMISRELAKVGHEVEVVTLDPSGRLEREEEYDGVRVRRFPCIAPHDTYFLPLPGAVRYLDSIDGDIVAHWWTISAPPNRPRTE